MERPNHSVIGVALPKVLAPGWRAKGNALPSGGHTRFFSPGDRSALIRLAYVVAGLHGVAALLLLIAYTLGGYALPN